MSKDETTVRALADELERKGNGRGVRGWAAIEIRRALDGDTTEEKR